MDVKSSEPREFIYTLIGMASDCQDREICVDYGKPLLDLFWEVVRFFPKSRREDKDEVLSREYLMIQLAATLGLQRSWSGDGLKRMKRAHWTAETRKNIGNLNYGKTVARYWYHVCFRNARQGK